MLRELGTRKPRCSDDVPIFGPELERCAMAIDVALVARIVSGPAKLLVFWINHHGLFTVSELRRIDQGRCDLQSTKGRRLFVCFLYFGLQPTMLETALGGPQRSETPPGVVNLESFEPPGFAPAAAGAPAAAEGAGATTTGERERCALDTNASASVPARTLSRQPVVMAPQAPWVLPPELAESPSSPATSPLKSSSNSSAATTSPLKQASTANGAASESPGGPAARMRART